MHTCVGWGVVVIHTIVGWECKGNKYSCRVLCAAMHICVGVGCGGNTYNCRGSLGYMMWEKHVLG